MATQVQQKPAAGNTVTGNSPSSTPAGQTARSGRGRLNFGLLVAWATKTLRGQFIAWASLLLLLSIIMGIIIPATFRQAHDDLNTIVASSAPSIDAALEMGQRLQDIDARAENFLATGGLTNLQDCTVPVTQYQPEKITVQHCDELVIENDITLFNQALYTAAQNVTFPGERTAIERITTGFEEYVSDITRMRQEYYLAGNKNDLHDEHIRRAHQAYNSASNVLLLHISRSSSLDKQGMHVYSEKNVPSCTIDDPLGQRTLLGWEWPIASLEVNINCLSAINKAQVDAVYDRAQTTMGWMNVVLIACCLLLCVGLLIASFRLARFTHRVINPGLSLATVLAIVFSIILVSHYTSMSGGKGSFKELVKDDYNNVYYAANLNRYATAARADESRWLIALQDEDQPQVNRWAEDWDKNKRRVEKLLQQANDNQKWLEASNSLTTLQDSWQNYENLDRQLREKALNASDPQRFTSATQLIAGEANTTFTTLSNAVTDLGKVNRDHFEQTYKNVAGMTADDVNWYSVLFPLIGLLAAGGVWLRLKDF